MSMTATTPETLVGSIERVTFHNPDNGFAVLKTAVKGHRDLVTVVGHLAFAIPGEYAEASGRWVAGHPLCGCYLTSRTDVAVFSGTRKIAWQAAQRGPAIRWRSLPAGYLQRSAQERCYE